MIEIKLQYMMWQRRVRSILELSRLARVSRQTIDALYNRADKVKGIKFETLERLWRALDCRIEDLIQYMPDSPPERSSRVARASEVRREPITPI